jgi:CelD/BcsL family acetyltransferase involved in cellulose biosynthesis
VATLYPLCELTPAHSDILRSSDRSDIVPAFFEALGTLPYRWDVLRFGRLLEAGTIGRQIAEYLPHSGFQHRIRREHLCFMLELGPTYDQFLADRSAKFRSYLRRKTRQLEAAGQIKVLMAGRDMSVDEAYDDLLSIEERSWKHKHGTAISAVPHQRQFYRLLCDGAVRSRRLHLILMYLNDVPIAFNLGIKVADRYSYLKTSFDEGMRRLSPATVLRARLVEALISEGVRQLDFPGQPYQWEEQWTDVTRPRMSVLVFNRTPLAGLYRLVVGLRDLLRHSGDGNGIRVADPPPLRENQVG